MTTATEHLNKLVAERHANVRATFARLISAFAKNNAAEVSAENAKLDDALKELGQVVARDHWPSWFINLQSNTSNYRTNHKNGKATWEAHIKSIIENYHLMMNHVWFSDEKKTTDFDPDKIIKSARAYYKIDEIFERLIESLRVLVKCDDLDSAKAIADLEEIIRIMQKAKSSSFTAQVASWQFVRRFVPNLISSYLRKSSVAGPSIEAFEKTAEELDIGISQAKDKISEDLLSIAKNSLRSKGLESITVSQIVPLPDLHGD